MQGVLRPKIAKAGGFESADALRIRGRTLFYYSFGKKDKKILANGGF